MITILPIFLLFISASIAILTTIIMAAVYFRQRKAYHELQTEYDQLWERVLLHAEAMIKRAHYQALKIIDDSELISGEMKDQVRVALTEAEQRESAEYQKVMSTIQQQLTSESLHQLDQFTQQLIDQTKSTQQSLQEKSTQTQTALDTYFQERKQFIDQQLEQHIFQIIQTVLQKTTKQLLTPDQHEQLILEALQQARQEYVL